MNDFIAKGKKIFTFTVVLTTIVWSIGIGALALPLAANAVASGDLIKGTGTAVYYYGADGKRYVFPYQAAYASWYGSDFSTVQTMTDAELIAIPFGGNVTIRPGKLAQVVSMDTPWMVMDPKVYAVEKGGVLRWVKTADVAVAIFGATWESMIYPLPEALLTNYTIGAEIDVAGDYDKAAQDAVADINEDLGLTGAGAGLTVALASDSPAAATVPTNADGVTVAKFSFNAAAAATLTDVVLHRVGVGAPSDIDNVYLYDGSTRLTSGRSVGTTSNLVEFHSLSVALTAGTPKTLTVKVDIGNPAATGGVHAFEIQDASAVTAGTLTTSAAAWPVRAADFTVGSAGVSTVTAQKGTTPADPTVGAVGSEISAFKLTAGTNDVAVSQIVLLQAGSVSNTDITDLELWVGSTKLAELASMSGDKMNFVLSEPYTIAAGVTKTFTVKATVGGRGDRKVKTYFEYASDVAVTDKTYGYGANVDITAFDGGALEFIEVTTKGGAITVAFNGPVATNVSKGAQDLTFYDFSLTSASADVEIRKLDIQIVGDGTGKLYEGTDRNLTDIKIKDQATGATLMGPKELAVAGGEAVTQTINFTDAWTLNAGETKRLIVTMDTRNTVDVDFVDHWFKVQLGDGADIFGADYIKNVDTGEYVTDIVPNSPNLGNAMTVKAASLTVTPSAVPASQNAVKRTTALDLVAFNMAAGSQSAVKVTALKLTGKGDIGDGTYAYAELTVGELDDVATSLKLYDGTTMLGTAKAPGTDGTATFSGLDWTIPAGETKKLTVKADLSSAIGDGNDDFAALGIAAAADITAEDADANAVTATDGDATWDGPKNDTGAAFPVLLTVKDSGTLTMALDPATPAAAIVVAGNSNVDVTKIKLSATMENFDVTTMSLRNAEYAADSVVVCAGDTDCAAPLTVATNLYGPDANWSTGADYIIVSANATYEKANDYVIYKGTTALPAEGAVIVAYVDLSITGGDASYTNGESVYLAAGAAVANADTRAVMAGAGFDDSVTSVTISYPTASGTETKTGYLSAGQVDFSGMNFRVPKDGDGVLTVKANLNTVTAGADSGDTPRLNFFGFNFAGVGQDSGTTIHGIAPAAAGNAMIVRKTKPTISLHASSPSGALVPGVTEVLRLNITADAAGDVYFDKGANDAFAAGDGRLSFKVNQSGGDSDAGDVCSLYDASDDTKIDEVTADFGVTAEIDFNFCQGVACATLGRALVVPAGSTKTVYVKCDLSDFATTGDTLRLDLEAETSGALAGTDNTRWHDNAAVDINGYLVKNLTVTGGTLVK